MERLKYIVLLTLLLPFFSSCDETDDITGIFTDKTWKLTEIFYEDGKLCLDYWTSEDLRLESYKLKAEKGNFVLTFEGIDTDGAIKGNYAGRAVGVTLSGSWTADGESRVFSTDQKTTTDKDVLGTAFIEGLSNAYAYKGDYDNLRIYFKRGTTKRYMLFHVEKQ